MNSRCIASRQFGSRRAALAELGIGEMLTESPAVIVMAYCGLGLKIPALARVTMGCRGGVGEVGVAGEVEVGESCAGGAVDVDVEAAGVVS